ncbi:uncharacterized protein BCR38DRAFT_30466 [Pseudomassariella vexata]|uniref:Tyrosinase copper-binding domain-containing protein n=1 Tax=Pseudomassariella vexata TaxID=1141098 RepID=A0A1Y2DQ55_9PEZI|nr:uncharacterized protein BCR38DRAFT_30466 [Pseudomassariella vexata]ORY61246.1 hypothetical protein BCR38DRAFT_30466 [Pseudomassariella vexata]
MVSIHFQLLSVLCISSFVSAAPGLNPQQLRQQQQQGQQATACTNPTQRKAWHKLTNVEKKDYVDATLCLMSKPATMGWEGATTRWDELTYVHKVNTNIVHNVGGLLPWHRYYVYLHEQMLKTECGYKGAQPYWETVLDVGNILGSSVLDPVTGFGGNGTGADLCVSDGPLANITLHMGPKYTNTDHCLKRNVNELVAQQNCSQSNIDTLFTYSKFSDVYDLFGNTIHTGGHSSIGGTGGTMTDLINSPGDPIFFLHHANLDRIWRKWQQVDPASRLYDIAGRNVPTADYISSRGLLEVSESQSLYFGDNGTETTLNHNMDMIEMLPNRTIRDVMDIKGDFLCYEYL